MSTPDFPLVLYKKGFITFIGIRFSFWKVLGWNVSRGTESSPCECTLYIGCVVECIWTLFKCSQWNYLRLLSFKHRPFVTAGSDVFIAKWQGHMCGVFSGSNVWVLQQEKGIQPLGFGKELNNLLPFPRNNSRNKMFSPELKWKADTTKALNWEIIDSLALGTEGIAHYLDFSKNWLCLLVGGPKILWKLLSMLTIKLLNSLLLSNSLKMDNLDLW